MVRAILLVVIGAALGAGAYHLIANHLRGLGSEVAGAPPGPSFSALENIGSSAAPAHDTASAFSQRSSAYQLAVQSDAASLRSLIEEAAAVSDSKERRFRLTVLLSRYVELAPRRAIAFANNLDLDRSIVAPLYASWARSEPSAALAALSTVSDARDAQAIGLVLLDELGGDQRALSQVLASLPPNLSGIHFRLEALRAMAVSTPGEALKQAMEFDDQQTRYKAVQRIAEIWAAQDPVKALDQIELIKDEGLRSVFLNQVIQSWSSMEPEAVLDYFANLDESDGHYVGAAASAIDDLARVDPMRALALSEQLPDLMRRSTQQIAVSRWAEKDPLAALEYVKSLPVGQQRHSLMEAVARGYGKTDPEAALVWAQDVGPPQHGILRSVLTGIAEKDPARAFDAVLSLESSGGQIQAMGMVMMMAAYGVGPEKMANRLLELPSGQVKDLGLQMLGSSWAQRDPEAALTWLMAHADKVGVHGFGEVAEALAQRDVRMAAGYIDKIPASARGIWVSKVAQSYAQADPAGAREWISRFRGEGIYDAGMAAVVQHSAQYDPQGGARLLETIRNPRYVGSAARMVAMYWAQEDGQSAAAWAQDLGSEQARAAAITSVVQQWGARNPDDARRWVLALPPDSTRDAALGSLLSSIASKKVPDEGLFNAFHSDAARQQAMPSIVYHVARHDPSAARALMDEYITDPTLRQQAEQMFDSGAAQVGSVVIQAVE